MKKKSFIIITLLFLSKVLSAQFVHIQDNEEFLVLPIGYEVPNNWHKIGKVSAPQPGLTSTPEYLPQLEKTLKKVRKKEGNILAVTKFVYIPEDIKKKEEVILSGNVYKVDDFDKVKKEILYNKIKNFDDSTEITIFRLNHKASPFENFKYSIEIDSNIFEISRGSNFKIKLKKGKTYDIKIPKYNLSYKLETGNSDKKYILCSVIAPSSAPRANAVNIPIGGYIPSLFIFNDENIGELNYSNFKNK